MQQLIELDKELFKLVNGQWTNSFFDWISPWLRNSTIWIPLYLFLMLFLLINFKKKGLWIAIFAIITIVITDPISSRVLKPFFNRLRPCNDPDMVNSIRFLLHYRPGSGSFPSSHAANHFALAMYLYAILRAYLGKWTCLFFVWAFCIGYAQVYVGVHYPFDIVGGAVFGCLVGYGTAYVAKMLVKQESLA
ncbi:MAG TPA: phosphatase PAP2 family protein [Ferruginibacter sp.]|jgi:undecaprenyl-diphosphatase|nr:phosphatase PAP2 family protein [Ferruginibacter sp.]